ncbi:hypothetical protein K491DRAFT_606743 [Lophiostoma macrostomum CBS 122681]|uniref:Uncharacterized protein n=1 Tax=Lophiostoma macrostomum CBS 122681 TaxID=1314788 RepID=A0A6A6SWR1_9PLEO|nr:hypothetical protein K491DRAFT_606743 [Lophiostoma macrostomum CBS 122681]
MLRQLLRAPSTYRTLLHPSSRPQSHTFPLLSHTQSQTRYLSLPRIIQPSFWAEQIPKPLRTNPFRRDAISPTPKDWNPATSYIILGLLVGSQAIQILWLKRDREHFVRKAEAKIGVLREVIESVQNGESVDVEKVLGTGDSAAEREWKEVMREIEEEDLLFRSKKRRRAAREQARIEEESGKVEETQAGEVQQEREKEAQTGYVKVESFKGARFY